MADDPKRTLLRRIANAQKKRERFLRARGVPPVPIELEFALHPNGKCYQVLEGQAAYRQVTSPRVIAEVLRQAMRDRTNAKKVRGVTLHFRVHVRGGRLAETYHWEKGLLRRVNHPDVLQLVYDDYIRIYHETAHERDGNPP